MIWKVFGEGADALLKSKITAANLPRVAQPQVITEIPKQQGKYVMKNPFKEGSELSKFGKQQIRGDFYIIDWNATFNRVRWLREEPAPLKSVGP